MNKYFYSDINSYNYSHYLDSYSRKHTVKYIIHPLERLFYNPNFSSFFKTNEKSQQEVSSDLANRYAEKLKQIEDYVIEHRNLKLSAKSRDEAIDECRAQHLIDFGNDNIDRCDLANMAEYFMRILMNQIYNVLCDSLDLAFESFRLLVHPDDINYNDVVAFINSEGNKIYFQTFSPYEETKRIEKECPDLFKSYLVFRSLYIEFFDNKDDYVDPLYD